MSDRKINPVAKMLKQWVAKWFVKDLEQEVKNDLKWYNFYFRYYKKHGYILDLPMMSFFAQRIEKNQYRIDAVLEWGDTEGMRWEQRRYPHRLP